MSNNQNNPQEVPQVKSVDRATEIIRRIPVHPANFDYISKRQYGINGSLAQDIKYAMKEYSQPFVDRIAELEKQNSELREALQEINEIVCDVRISSQPKVYSVIRIAEQALNSKEVGEQ